MVIYTGKEIYINKRKTVMELISNHKYKQPLFGAEINKDTVPMWMINDGLDAFCLLANLNGRSSPGGADENGETDDSLRIELPRLLAAYFHNREARAKINAILDDGRFI